MSFKTFNAPSGAITPMGAVLNKTYQSSGYGAKMLYPQAHPGAISPMGAMLNPTTTGSLVQYSRSAKQCRSVEFRSHFRDVPEGH